tara:strand:- start:400 stop:1116 length:717 start_codon:yes stop_codon:yes gene_type:complete
VSKKFKCFQCELDASAFVQLSHMSTTAMWLWWCAAMSFVTLYRLENMKCTQLNGAIVRLIEKIGANRAKVSLMHDVHGEGKFFEGKVLSVANENVKSGAEREIVKNKKDRSRSPRRIAIKGHEIDSVSPKCYESILNKPSEEEEGTIVYRNWKKKVYRSSVLVKHRAEVGDEQFECMFMLFLTSDEKSAMPQLLTAAGVYGISTGNGEFSEELEKLPPCTAAKVRLHRRMGYLLCLFF